MFASRHDDVDEKLKELKNIIITYYPTQADNNIFYSVLFDIFTAEQDLGQHTAIENRLFIPAVALMEHEVSKTATPAGNTLTIIRPTRALPKKALSRVKKPPARR